MGSRGKEENAFVRLRASIEASREEGGYGGLGLPSWQTHLQKKWNRHRGQVLWNGSIGLWDQEDRWTVFPGIYNRSLLAFLRYILQSFGNSHLDNSFVGLDFSTFSKLG